MSRVTMAKIEEIEILAVVFLVDGNVNVLMNEEFQGKREKIRIKEELSKVFELEDVYIS